VHPTNSLLLAVNEASTTQAKLTELTKEECQQILDYTTIYNNVFIQFHASDMISHVDSDTAYLALPNTRSRVARYYYLSDHLKKAISHQN